MNFSDRILALVVRSLDQFIRFLTDKFKLTFPVGIWLIFWRIFLFLAFLQGTAQAGGALFYVYTSGLLPAVLAYLTSLHPIENFLAFARRNPIIASLPFTLVLFAVTVVLAGIKTEHKKLYGVAEMICGFISSFAMLTALLKRSDFKLEVEWTVGFVASLYLAAEGASIILEEKHPPQITPNDAENAPDQPVS